MNKMLKVLVWIPVLPFAGFALTVLCRWIFFGVALNEDVANRAFVSSMIALMVGGLAAWLSAGVIE